MPRDYKGEYKALSKALVGETGASAINEASLHKAMRLALENAANQPLIHEMTGETYKHADFEAAYETMVEAARWALGR